MVSSMKLQRIQKEITQIDLWMKTGIPQWRISLIERGIKPRPKEAEKIATVLETSVEDLFGDQVARQKTTIHGPCESIAL